MQDSIAWIQNFANVQVLWNNGQENVITIDKCINVDVRSDMTKDFSPTNVNSTFTCLNSIGTKYQIFLLYLSCEIKIEEKETYIQARTSTMCTTGNVRAGISTMAITDMSFLHITTGTYIHLLKAPPISDFWPWFVIRGHDNFLWFSVISWIL